MVTQHPPDSTQTPPNGAAQQRQPNRVPWTDEQSDNAWEDVAPQRQASNASFSIRRKDIPAVLKPGSGVPVGPVDDEEDNVWDEARNQPSGSNPLEQAPDSLKPGVKRIPPLQPPTESFSNLGLHEPTNNYNPWQSTTETQPTQVESKPHSVAHSEIDSDPWARSTPEPPAKEQLAPKSPDLMSLHSEGSGWEEEPHNKKDQRVAPAKMAAMADELLREQQVWDDLDASDPAKKAKAVELPVGESVQLDDWNLIDAEPSSSLPHQIPLPVEPPQPGATEDDRPPLPPRLTGEMARWTSSRLPVDGKSETYQVKNIQWYDASSNMNPRVSPILIQNENGPCPLVALVNALTLTTPADIPDTALVQVLRSREQVSLNLLLDAVFDELMSPRRTNSEEALPDVSDLYAFLQSLHTGMNVNPRFIPTPGMVNAYKRTSLTHLHPSERGNLIPGTFENTLEMSLYATFSIPLIHGWLPPRDDPAYSAMERFAGSYEDVQNLLFREEELEDKLSGDIGLTEAEQELYQDIITIRMFLEASATQLTPWGIEVIGKAIRPGTFAILFRNDHFSTLYCHPETMQLYTLVTDAGYRGHDEIVWESLLDVNGEQNEYLSGDFRVTSGDAVASSSSRGRSEGHGGAWTTVNNRRGKTREQEEVPMSPSTEQEDRDLALALQLQEEEDQRHREEQERRQRETILSERFIEQQAHRPVPAAPGGRVDGLVPQRRSSNSVNVPVTTTPTRSQEPTPRQSAPIQQVRSLVPPRRPGVNRPANSEDEPPPPSYEQAAQVPAYVPPLGHPTHPGSSTATSRAGVAPTGPGGRGQRPPGVPAGGRRQPVSASGSGSQNRGDRDCVVM
ncbi:Ubiquitin carboxyl-terminal hydrolase MIY1 [Cladobotryum mycophilum]|uniref:Ubiquitin carboxyl-terminal hydrolase MIY1 n=1 Tax=Cladobotryum mycophilum TaxID=491253 RepID=A0ABR0SIQ0_9HYPO